MSDGKDRQEALQEIERLLWKVSASYKKDGLTEHNYIVCQTIDNVVYLKDYSPVPTPTQETHRLHQVRVSGLESENTVGWAKWLLTHIRVVVEDGLPTSYEGDIRAFMTDWNDDAPYLQPVLAQVLSYIKTLPEFPMLREAFRRRFGVDFWEGRDSDIRRASL